MSTKGPRGRVIVEEEVGIDGSVKKTRVVSNVPGSADLATQAESELQATLIDTFYARVQDADRGGS